MKNKLLAIAIGSVLALSACSDHHNKTARITTPQPAVVREYKTVDNSGNFLFWYILLSGNNTYYYSSPTRVWDYSSVSFTRSQNNELPSDISTKIQSASEVVEKEIPVTQEPPAVIQDQQQEIAQAQQDQQQIEAMENEGGPPSPEPETSSSSDTSSTDTSSSSSNDSGGGSSDSGSSGSD